MTKENEPFAELIRKKGGNKAAIGKKLGGVPGQRIGQYIQGRQKPKEDFFQKWEATYGENIRSMFVETNVSRETQISAITVESKDVSGLIESNKVLSEANKTLADAHKVIADAHQELIQLFKISYSRPLSTDDEQHQPSSRVRAADSEAQHTGRTGPYADLDAGKRLDNSNKKGK